MGRILPGFEAKVVDKLDSPVADGMPGELVLRNEEPFSFCNGYLAMPERTVEEWRNLWYHTHDTVVRDRDGFFRFVDRDVDAIRRRGENVSSLEVEEALLTHPDVVAAAAYGVPSDLAEDDVMVTVVLRQGITVEPDALIAHCESRLPKFSVPRYLAFAEQLPLTANGKVQKHSLREAGVQPNTWDRDRGLHHHHGS